MNPAESETLKQALASQAAKVHQHDSSLHQIMDHLQQLATSVAQLGNQLAAMRDQLDAAHANPVAPQQADQISTPASLAREPFIPIPARYGGDLGTCSQFLHQCSLVFSQQPNTYATQEAKVAFIMSLLTGQAAAWALAISSQHANLRSDYLHFTEEMKRVFDHPVKGRQAVGHLLDMQQGNQSVSQYALEFRILAAESGWGETELQTIFKRGLNSSIQDELALRDECGSLNQLIDIAIRLDNRIRERVRERQEAQRRRPQPSAPLPANGLSPTSSASGNPAPPVEEPMQLGRARLTPAERQRRMEGRLCLYCGQGGHFIGRCPEASKGRAHQ